MTNHYLSIFKSLLLVVVFGISFNSYSQQRKLLRGEDAKEIDKDFSRLILNENDIVKFIEFEQGVNFSSSTDLASKFGLSDRNRFKVYNQFRSSKNQSAVYRLQQVYEGIAVMGGNYVIQQREGLPTTGSGMYFKIENKLSHAVLSKQNALRIALSEVNAESYMWENESNEKFIRREMNDDNATFYPTGKLVYTSKKYTADNPLRLAYQFEIYASKPVSRYRIEIDAENGKVINKYNLLHTQTVDGTGISLYNGEVDLTLFQDGNNYLLNDTERGQGIYTYDMQNDVNYGSAINFSETDNFIDQEANQTGVSAHFGAAATYDYFFENFGLNSFDGNGAAINSFVHYDNDFVNAFWDGQRMTYGDGDQQAITALVSIDIVGHEIAHAVTQYSADLIYMYESGALNESFSDIFGQAIEFEAAPETASWNLADEIFTNGVDMIRSISDPKSQGQPDTYLGENWEFTDFDNGGVHINSGVQNYWFYLLVEGGSGVNDNGEEYTVAPIGLEKAQQIAFRNLFFYLNQSSQFVDARFGSEQAAIDLYGEDSPEYEAVRAAWNAVGVPSTDPEIIVDDNYNFGKTVIGETSLIIPIANAGLADLEITDLTVDNEDFQIPQAPITIASGETYELIMNFTATAIGQNTATLVISNNDEDKSLSLNVQVVEEPDFSLSTRAIAMELLAGNNQSEQITIQNNNDYDLIFDIEADGNANQSRSATYTKTGDNFMAGKANLPSFKSMQTSIAEDDDRTGGYSWTDQTSFNWLDISQVGTAVSLSDDSNSGLINMGFDFVYFDNSFDQVAICSNGWASFTNSSGDIWNSPLPSNGAPDNVIALMATDLHPGNGECYYYYDQDNNRFVIQYSNWSLYSNREAEFDMQIHIYQNGRIKLLYSQISLAENAAVGIQNSLRELGFTVSYGDASFFQNNYAVEIAKASLSSNWLSFEPNSVTVPANATASFNASLDSEGLFAGEYSSDIVLKLVEFQDLQDSIAVNLTVLGTPNLEEATFDLGEILVNSETEQLYYLKNIGNETIDISNISLQSETDLINFQLSENTIAPFDSVEIALVMNASEPSVISNKLLVTSNDTQNETTEFVLTGEFVDEPELNFSEMSFEFNLEGVGSDSQSLSILNNSSYSLDITLDTEYLSNGRPSYEREIGQSESIGKIEVPKFKRIEKELNLYKADDLSGGYSFRDTESGLIYDWFDIQEVGTSVSLTDDSNSDFIDLGFQFEFFDDSFEEISIGSNGWLSFTNSSGNIWSNPLPTQSAPENVIAILASDLFPGTGSCHYYFEEEQNRFIVQFTDWSYCCTSQDLFTMQAQIYSNGDIVLLYDDIRAEANGTVGIQNADKTLGLTVAHFEPDRIVSGYGVKISSTTDWLRLSKQSISLNSDESEDVTIDVTTEDLLAGSFKADILISESKFGTQFTAIPITLNLIGRPVFEFESDQYDFGHVVIDGSKSLKIPITNSGNDVLEIEANITGSNFVLIDSTYTIEPRSMQFIETIFQPSAFGEFSAELNLRTNDDTNTSQLIQLSGTGLYPARASVSDSYFTIVMEQDEETTESFSVSNEDESVDLNYSIRVEVEEEGMSVSSKQSSAAIGFYATRSSNYEGSKTFSRMNQLTPHDKLLQSKNDLILDTLNNIPFLSTGAVLADGYFYIVSYSEQNVSKYDMQQEQVVATFPIHPEPFGMVFNGSNFLIGSRDGIVYAYDTDFELVGDFNVPFSGFPALAFDGFGLIVANALESNSEIYRVDVDGSVLETYSIEYSDVISQIHFSNNRLWVLDANPENTNIFGFRKFGTEWNKEVEITGSLPYEAYTLASTATDLVVMIVEEQGFVIDNGASWLNALPASGSVSAGESRELELILNSTGLDLGTYRAILRVETNDPDNPEFTVNVDLSLGNNPPEQVLMMEDVTMQNDISNQMEIDLNEYFIDDKSEVILYDGRTTVEDVVDLSIDNNMMTITPLKVGETEVELSAFDGQIYSFSNFKILVEEYLGLEGASQSLLLYPNPTKDFIQIESNAKMQFSIFDIKGKRIRISLEKIASGYKIDLTDLVDGLYFIKAVDQESNEYHGKIMKN